MGSEAIESLQAATVGTWITLRGFDGDSGCFVIKWFQLEEGGAENDEKSFRMKVYDYYGGETKFRQHQKEFFDEMKTRNYV